MKGFSPLIAVVILIAISISIGISLSTGMIQIVKEGTGQSDVSCATNTYYTIESANFNELGNDKLIAKVTNRGNTNIYGFAIILYGDSGLKLLERTEVDQGDISNQNPLKKGRSALLKGIVSHFGSIKEIVVLNTVCGTVAANKVI